MATYAIRRLLLMIPTLVLVTLIVFFSVRFIPGNVIDLMMAQMTEEAGAKDIAAMEADIRHKLGLDVPVHIQYGRWLGIVRQEDGNIHGIFQGNLGDSLWRKVPVKEEILQRLPVTLELGAFGIITALILALPIGVYSAIRQDTGGDYLGRTIAILAISLPSFWVGTMVVVYPSIWWGWAPAMEYINPAQNLPANLIQFLIPGIIMGMLTSGSTMRITRTMMLEVLRQDYIRTAWAKGLSERTIIVRHAMKNALIPVVTVIALRVPLLIGGTVVIETIFSLPGIGRLLVDALNKRDYPIISGINLMLAVFVLLMNLLVDLTYGYLDPRVVYK
ncbi:MAG: ABC transporter permease [Chloroflexi bacterium]|nr:ABC transporter permease [Chloroflexota bacterium]MBI3931374.1 ABC transporter permease [Chloroflexota bacterium]